MSGFRYHNSTVKLNNLYILAQNTANDCQAVVILL